jgi:hypothetical protein
MHWLTVSAVSMGLVLAGLTDRAQAQEFSFLGATVFHSNDVLLDGDDRWQTSGTSVSWVFGPEGTKGLPQVPGELWELRLRAQIVSPDNFTAPAAWDRRAAGVLTTTLHSHFQTSGFDVSVGAGFALTGPQTRLIDLQNFVHTLTPVNDPTVPGFVQDAQIANGFYPTVSGEVAYRVRLGDAAALRPFAEVQGGVETFARVGFDVFFGRGFDSGVLARDGTTGFAYQTLEDAAPRGFTLTAGMDAAKVLSSALLPAPAYELTPLRVRARAGLMYQGSQFSVFQGFTWLGPEFVGQPTGQIVTAFQVQFRF